METEEVMLTTIDNPWNPWTHWDEWYAWDEAAGYHTSSYLARITKTSEDAFESTVKRDLLNAINEILELNLSGNYRKIHKTDKTPLMNQK